MMNLQTETESAARDAALELVHQMARLFNGRTLSAQDASRAFRGVCEAVELMRER